MAVVSASVKYIVVDRAIVGVPVFPHGQRVHIGTQAYREAFAAFPAQSTDHAGCAADAGCHIQAPGFEQRRHLFGCAMLFKAELGMFVYVTPPLAHVCGRSEEHTSELQSLMRI